MGKNSRGKISPDRAKQLRQQAKRSRKAAQLAKAARLANAGSINIAVPLTGNDEALGSIQQLDTALHVADF